MLQPPGSFLPNMMGAAAPANLRSDAPTFTPLQSQPINIDISTPRPQAAPTGTYNLLGMTVQPLAVADTTPADESDDFPWWPTPLTDAGLAAFHSNTR